MLAKKRQEQIYEQLRVAGAVMTADLMERFGVSVETIRKDLLLLEKQGLLKRVHGGAVAESDMKQWLPLQERNNSFSAEKRELAVNASKFLQEGDIIAVDAGSTAICFAEVLKEKFADLTVVTGSLDVFNILAHQKAFSVILCGGHFLKEENAFYGSLALDTLRKLHVKKAFIFPSAVSAEFGICDYQQELYQMQRQMIACADKVFILADSSKFEKRALLKLEDMKPEFYYITDKNLSAGLEKLYADSGRNIYKGE